MTDDLDTKTPVELNEIFAEDVLNLQYERESHTWRKEDGSIVFSRPASTISDVTIPFLNEYPWLLNAYPGKVWILVYEKNRPGLSCLDILSEATSDTFAKCACIALVRAKRKEKGLHNE